MKGFDYITSLVKDKVFGDYDLTDFDRFIKQHFGDRKIVGAEIGVLAGDHARSMLVCNRNISKLYLIDSYINYQGYDKNFADFGLSNYEQIAHSKMSEFGSRYIFVKSFFEECLDYLPVLDFCFYDIDSNYKRQYDYLDLYWSKIKPGGVIGGCNYNANLKHRGIVDAVNMFIEENNLGSYLDGGRKSAHWWVVKGDLKT